MPLNRDFIGREYPSAGTYVVSRAAIRDFAVAINDRNPLYLDREAARAAGYADVIAPPTFLVSMGARDDGPSIIADPDLGLDFSRIVHSEQRFTLHRPVMAGDELSSVMRVVEIKDVSTNELIGLDTDVRDAAGELVAVLYLSMVSRGTAAPKEA